VAVLLLLLQLLLLLVLLVVLLLLLLLEVGRREVVGLWRGERAKANSCTRRSR
jgi:hypothetical protein